LETGVLECELDRLDRGIGDRPPDVLGERQVADAHHRHLVLDAAKQIAVEPVGHGIRLTRRPVAAQTNGSLFADRRGPSGHARVDQVGVAGDRKAGAALHASMKRQGASSVVAILLAILACSEPARASGARACAPHGGLPRALVDCGTWIAFSLHAHSIRRAVSSRASASSASLSRSFTRKAGAESSPGRWRARSATYLAWRARSASPR